MVPRGAILLSTENAEFCVCLCFLHFCNAEKCRACNAEEKRTNSFWMQKSAEKRRRPIKEFRSIDTIEKLTSGVVQNYGTKKISSLAVEI